MTPVPLRTARLVLDLPTEADIDAITAYCQDALFERYLTTPWPYTRDDAVGFVTRFVPDGWATGTERVWAIRRNGALLGVISVRRERGMVGFWLGAQHRRQGYLTEALTAVVDHAFASGRPVLGWECVAGNVASARTARAVGFRYTGTGPARVPDRNGATPEAWQGELHRSDPRGPADGWPPSLLGRTT